MCLRTSIFSGESGPNLFDTRTISMSRGPDESGSILVFSNSEDSELLAYYLLRCVIGGRPTELPTSNPHTQSSGHTNQYTRHQIVDLRASSPRQQASTKSSLPRRHAPALTT